MFERFNNKNSTLDRKNGPFQIYKSLAISNYEQYFKSNGYDIKVDLCSLVIDEQNYILGDTADGKVNFNDSYGI